MEDPTYYIRIGEALKRFEIFNSRNLEFYIHQCGKVVEDFVHVRTNLVIRSASESASIFKELFRLTCKAERVLANCSREDWLAAAIVQDDRYVFESIRDDLKRCLDTGHSLTRPLAERREQDGLFEADQEHLREKLTGFLAREGTLRDRLIARALLQRGEDRVFDGVWIIRHNGSELDNPLDLCRPSTVKEITWLGVRLVEKSFPDDDANRDACSKEASLMAKLKHPNVVRFVSCLMEPGERPRIIMGREETTLEQYLSDHKMQDLAERLRMSQRPLGPRAGPLLDLLVAVDIMDQIASGMAYLHSQNVVHLDLKPVNVLLTVIPRQEFPQVKIADLGTSIELDFEGERLELDPNLGTTRYRPPEFSSRRPICPKAADVYCFGMTIWQILHCQAPILTTMEPITCLDHVLRCKGPTLYDVRATQLGLEVVKGRRLTIDSAVPAPLADLIRACWHTDPDSRLTFSAICLHLQSFRASLLGGALPQPLSPPPEPQPSMVRCIRKATKNVMLRILPSPEPFRPVFPGDREED